jgi:hypothetical protein
MLLVFTEDNVPTWEIRRKAKKVAGRDDDLVVSGTADTFEAATRRAFRQEFQDSARLRRGGHGSRSAIFCAGSSGQHS